MTKTKSAFHSLIQLGKNLTSHLNKVNVVWKILILEKPNTTQVGIELA